ncbi:MAG: stage II sporulation protein P, partial [Acutalibacteraceae bacterium]|nr:stage II sporulation protein P [Acutalibacteraceae bacterium]
AIGERVAAELKAAGIGVIHDKTLHDYPSYTGSYTQSAKTIKAYLKKYPSIKVVLDVHRDAVNGDGTDKIKLVSEQGGKKAAQVMLVMGSQTGNVTGFPEWKQNFRLAVRFQQKMETMYKGLARPLYFMSRQYNQTLTTGSMLLEVGTEANSMEEALYSGTLAGKALAATLLELT